MLDQSSWRWLYSDRGDNIKTIQPLSQPQPAEPQPKEEPFEKPDSTDSNVKSPAIRDSFSDTPVRQFNEHDDQFIHTARQSADHSQPSSYEIAQLPKMVYVVAILSLLSAIVSFIFAYDSLSFVIAIFSFVIAIGLLLRFNLARKITIVLALVSVVISVVVLTQIAHFKSQTAQAFRQLHQAYNSSFVANNDPIAQSTGDQQYYSQALDTAYSIKLKRIDKMRATVIWTAVFCSAEALYFLSPRVKAAYES